MKCFVIVIDMQKDFVNAQGALPVAEAEALVEPIGGWLAALKPNAVAGVLFTKDTHDPEIYAVSEEAKLFPPHCERGTSGWELVVDPTVLDPAIPRFTLEKGVFDMWAEPDISLQPHGAAPRVEREAFFAQLRAGDVEDVTVIGVAADYCVRWAVEGLLARGFRVSVPANFTRGIARQIDAVAVAEWAGAEVRIV